jgi:DNA-binding FadR family transcriptional regulator
MRILIEEIVDGEHAPGDMLPREVALAERFDISRGVAREVIRGLEERGLVAVKHGRGATVCDDGDWDVLDPDVVSAMLAGPAARQLIEEAVECQRIFEVEAAGWAAERAGPEQLEALTQAFEALNAAASRAERSEAAARRYREAEADFHRAVVRATGNRILARMSEPLHRALGSAATGGGRRPTGQKRILAAIRDGDPEAARSAMARHLAGASRRRRARANA